MAKVTSYAYVNPVVAVLLGIFLLHERPEAAEFIGMASGGVRCCSAYHRAGEREDQGHAVD